MTNRIETMKADIAKVGTQLETLGKIEEANDAKELYAILHMLEQMVQKLKRSF